MWSYRTEKYLCPQLNKGYLNVKLHKDNKEKTFSIHRLVALAFIENPYNKREVNHIDEDKTNNNVWNLEWVTSKENANHGTRNQRIREWVLKHPIQHVTNGRKPGIHAAYGKDPIKVAKLDKNSEEIIEIYSSIAEAARKNNCRNGHICWCCLGKKKQHMDINGDM